MRYEWRKSRVGRELLSPALTIRNNFMFCTGSNDNAYEVVRICGKKWSWSVSWIEERSLESEIWSSTLKFECLFTSRYVIHFTDQDSSGRHPRKRVERYRLLHSVEVRVASRGQEIVWVASRDDRFKCISCVSGFQPQAYELRPAFSKELHQLHRKLGVYKMSNIWKVLTQFYRTLLYTIICTHTELLNDTDITIVISCYGLMFKIFKNALLGRRQAHYIPNISRFKLLLWSDENTICGKSCNAVSLGVPSTWTANCAHIIIIQSAESPAWYLINSVVSVLKLFNWFSKYVW
jgi:hypothetical protein